MLWIVGILAALVVLICCIRMGVLVTFAGQSAVVELKIALFHIQCYPAKENGKAAQKQAETAAKAGDQAVKKELPKFEDIREAAKALWPPLRRALGRLGRGIRVDPLDLRVILGGARDPAQTARMYGYLHAGIWTIMPAMEELVEIRKPYLHVGVDYENTETILHGQIGISARLGTLLRAALSAGIPAIRWFLQHRKNMSAPTQAAA